MKHSMRALLVTCGTLVSALGVGAGTTPAHAEGKTITLCWAAWDPANALVELSKDFTAKTGVEMEALTAVSVSALTIYDMCKGIDKTMVIDGIRCVRKTGGKSS